MDEHGKAGADEKRLAHARPQEPSPGSPFITHRSGKREKFGGAGATGGDYLQLDIPAYETVRFRDFDMLEPFATVWRNQHGFDLVARNPEAGRRSNYSLAGNPHRESVLRFNVRIATPPPGQDGAPAWDRATSSASSPATS